jgi:hypothetical protein
MKKSLAVCSVAAALVSCGDDSGQGGQGGTGTQGPTGPATTSASGSTGGEGGAIPDGCTEIEASGPSTYYSVDAVGFAFSPAKATAAPEVVVVSPNINGVVAPGNYELAALDGEIISFAIEDAVVDLINAPNGAMDRRIFAATAGTVAVNAAPSYGTQFQGRIAGALDDVVYRELDDAFEVIEGGECWFLREGSFDASSYDAKCDAPTDVAATPSGGACLADYVDLGHDCNPVTNDGCLPGEACDLGLNFECFPATGGEAALCAACDNAAMQFCAVGLTCDSNNDVGKCHRYCCTDADCGAGGTCIAYYAYGVGVCMES